MKIRIILAIFLTGAMWVSAHAQDPIISVGDPILAIDFDSGFQSDYPGGEEPFNIGDSDSSTKYLNFGKENTGFIVTPLFGSTTVQSMYFTSANDAPERDPASWELFGTNDPIQSLDNSDAMGGENWTMIASGAAMLPQMREMDGPVYTFANATSYSSYLVTFPTLRNANAANSMQLADVYMFESSDGSGMSFLNFFDDVLAVDVDGLVSESAYPAAESPADAIDNNLGTKYLNFGLENSGFIVTPSAGPSVVDSFQISTANDFEDRDPASYELYGTNDPITSADNSTGDEENWTLISSGSLNLPLDRNTPGDVVAISNTTEYSSYRMVFPTVRNINGTMVDSTQYSEVQLFGTANNVVDGDFNGDESWDCADIDALVAEIVAGTNDPAFDMNGDGVVNRADITDSGFGWLAVGGANNPGATGGNAFLVGDANLDGAVDGADFITWNGNKFTNVSAWCSGDFTADGAVDGGDFIEWNNFKFMSSDSAATNHAAVPEPSSALIAVFAFLATLRRRTS